MCNFALQETPIGPFVGSVIKPRIGLTPILRAGLGMTDALVRWYSSRLHPYQRRYLYIYLVNTLPVCSFLIVPS